MAKTDKENVPYHEQYLTVTPIDDRETDCKRDLLCEEVLKGTRLKVLLLFPIKSE